MVDQMITDRATIQNELSDISLDRTARCSDMKALPWPPLGSTYYQQYITTKETRLSDCWFSDKADVIVPAGSVLTLKTGQNYGLVISEEYGCFRY